MPAPSELVTRYVEQYESLVWTFVRARLLHDHDADEVSQTVWHNVWRKCSGESPPSFDSEEKVKSWLLCIAANVVRDHFRRRRHPQIEGTDVGDLGIADKDDVETQVDIRELSEVIRGCLEHLSGTERQIIQLIAEGAGTGEICRQLTRTAPQIYKLTSTARTKLERCIELRRPS